MDQQEERKAEEKRREEEKKAEERKQEEARKAEERKREEAKREEEKQREERKEKRERKPYVFAEQQQVQQVCRAKPAPAKQDLGGPRQGDDELQMALSMDHPGLSDAQKSTLVHMGYKSNSAFDAREAERKGSAAKTDHAKPAAARQVYEFSNEKDQGRPDMQR